MTVSYAYRFERGAVRVTVSRGAATLGSVTLTIDQAKRLIECELGRGQIDTVLADLDEHERRLLRGQ
jgi:hypothetical protein